MQLYYQLRPIQPQDNVETATLIQTVLREFGVTSQESAYGDPELDHLFETYQQHRSQFWVIENIETKKLYGSGGVAVLKGEKTGTVCELQKLYYLPALRGLGWGKKLIDLTFSHAKNNGFTAMYLETVPWMENAIHLYQKMGFQFLDKPMGNTGHTACTVWMLKPF